MVEKESVLWWERDSGISHKKWGGGRDLMDGINKFKKMISYWVYEEKFQQNIKLILMIF